MVFIAEDEVVGKIGAQVTNIKEADESDTFPRGTTR